MKFAAFDLEIMTPVEGDDWKAQRPLGISCAAVALRSDSGELTHRFWGIFERQTALQQPIVAALMELVHDGYTLVTWNGGAFDFDILAEESGLHAQCAELARNHIDLMAIVVAMRGHRLALDTAAQGMGIRGKMKSVTLRDGTILEGMDGAQAPALWQQGEYAAVWSYLREDVRVTLELAEAIEAQRVLRWTARSGKANVLRVPHLYTIDECLALWEALPPDNGWMTDPPDLRQMLGWMVVK